MEPGRGALTMAALLDPRAFGGALTYRHRISDSWAAGADALATLDLRTRTVDWRALLALETRF